MSVIMEPIAFVRNNRKEITDDHWEEVISEIHLASYIPTEAFLNIELFSHLEIIFYFDKIDTTKIVFSRKPRGKEEFPTMGILAQRNKDRPNGIGLTTVTLLEHQERKIKVKYLDAIDGTPILDIKPAFKDFGAKTEIHQPGWVNDLMKEYW